MHTVEVKHFIIKAPLFRFLLIISTFFMLHVGLKHVCTHTLPNTRVWSRWLYTFMYALVIILFYLLFDYYGYTCIFTPINFCSLLLLLSSELLAEPLPVLVISLPSKCLIKFFNPWMCLVQRVWW